MLSGYVMRKSPPAINLRPMRVPQGPDDVLPAAASNTPATSRLPRSFAGCAGDAFGDAQLSPNCQSPASTAEHLGSLTS